MSTTFSIWACPYAFGDYGWTFGTPLQLPASRHEPCVPAMIPSAKRGFIESTAIPARAINQEICEFEFA